MLSPMDEAQRDSAERIRALIERGPMAPALFREALTSIPPAERDAWVDRVLGLDSIPEDGPELPRGCVPYLPCSIDALLRLTEQAAVDASDVFVDVGSGVGRAAALVHLLTGAAAVGIEIQPALVSAARQLTHRLHLANVSFVAGDAAEVGAPLTTGSVFLLYCPFSGDRLVKLLATLEVVARTRLVRICCVDLPLPACNWLELVPPPAVDLTIHRSTLRPNRSP
jgi:SAM-dependent methyltransferase